LEPTGLPKPSETHRLLGKGPGLALQHSADGVFEQLWNYTDMFLLSKPGPLVGYPGPLLTVLLDLGNLAMMNMICSVMMKNK